MTGEILVFAEEPANLPHLLARAAALRAGSTFDLGAVVLAGEGDTPSLAPGAAHLYRLTGGSLTKEAPELVALALADLVRRRSPRLLLLASTKRGREYAARLGGLIDAPVATGVGEITLGADAIAVKREMLSGNALGEENLAAPFAIVALQPGEAAAPLSEPLPAMEEVKVDLPAPTTKVVERIPKPSGGVHLESADRIVSIGRGLQKKEDLALVEEVARRLGAAVGCTRPIAAEAGWLSDDHWIGLTGHRVKPRLYVAIGISGAVQHLVGMRESKVVVAINKDANAPIFQQADYRVQGDLYQILPELAKLLPPG